MQLTLTPSLWTVEKCSIDGFITVVDLRPSGAPMPTLAAASGRVAAADDVVASEMVVAMFDAPGELRGSSDKPALWLAATAASPGWKTRIIAVEVAGQRFNVRSAGRKTKLGHAVTVLGQANAHPIDMGNTVDVDLVDSSQWLLSCDDDALAAGANAAILGDEIVQFGEAIPLDNGRFRLSRLLRGRFGTEAAIGRHSIGEKFILLEADTLRPIELPPWATGAIDAEGRFSTRVALRRNDRRREAAHRSPSDASA